MDKPTVVPIGSVGFHGASKLFATFQAQWHGVVVKCTVVVYATPLLMQSLLLTRRYVWEKLDISGSDWENGHPKNSCGQSFLAPRAVLTERGDPSTPQALFGRGGMESREARNFTAMVKDPSITPWDYLEGMQAPPLVPNRTKQGAWVGGGDPPGHGRRRIRCSIRLHTTPPRASWESHRHLLCLHCVACVPFHVVLFLCQSPFCRHNMISIVVRLFCFWAHLFASL